MKFYNSKVEKEKLYFIVQGDSITLFFDHKNKYVKIEIDIMHRGQKMYSQPIYYDDYKKLLGLWSEKG